MPRRSFDTWVYHVYNRWFDKMNIFKNKSDFQRFYEIFLFNLELEVFSELKVISYSFLPNHFHLIIFNPGVELSLLMWRLQNAYAKYFNLKYERKWPLFEWRFRAKLIDDDQYLYQAISYVNLNAKKHKIVQDIKDYPWTSYHQIMNGTWWDYLSTGLQIESLQKFADIEIQDFEY